jgi:hypothetical protein
LKEESEMNHQTEKKKKKKKKSNKKKYFKKSVLLCGSIFSCSCEEVVAVFLDFSDSLLCSTNCFVILKLIKIITHKQSTPPLVFLPIFPQKIILKVGAADNFYSDPSQTF